MSAVGLDAAEQIGGGLTRMGLYYAVGILAVAILGLFALLIRAQQLRIGDLRALTRETVEAIERNSAALVTLTQVVGELQRRKQRPSSRTDIPAVQPQAAGGVR